MIRTTSSASRITVPDAEDCVDICSSAGAILADQLLWRKLKRLSWAVLGQGLQCSKNLTESLSWITTIGLLQIHQSLLTETAVVTPRS